MSARWVYEEDDDDSENRFQKFTEHRKKPPEYSREDNRKLNKPQRPEKEKDEDD